MPQPIIDPEKVDAWAASVRAVFSSGPGGIGTWLALGLTLLILALALYVAMDPARRRQPDALEELQKLIEAEPGPKAFSSRPRVKRPSEPDQARSLFGPP